MIHLWQKNEPIPWELLLLADPEKELVAAYLKQGELFIFKEGTEIRGLLVSKALKNTQFEIMNVAVNPKYQNQGIGMKLVKYALKKITEIKRKEKYTEIEVLVRTGDLSKAAIALYKKCGFQEKEVIKNYFLIHYTEPIYEEGILLKNQLILHQYV